MAGALVAVLIALPTLVFAAGEGEIFIDNGKIRLGVDLESGGSVFYLSESAPGATCSTALTGGGLSSNRITATATDRAGGKGNGAGIQCKAGITRGLRLA